MPSAAITRYIVAMEIPAAMAASWTVNRRGRLRATSIASRRWLGSSTIDRIWASSADSGLGSSLCMLLLMQVTVVRLAHKMAHPRCEGVCRCENDTLNP